MRFIIAIYSYYRAFKLKILLIQFLLDFSSSCLKIAINVVVTKCRNYKMSVVIKCRNYKMSIVGKCRLRVL